jgi:hypothetical protein
MSPTFEKKLLDSTNSTAFKLVEVIQTLWSGYGTISRYALDNSPWKTVVVKHISANPFGGHPRGWNSDFGHNRKVKSYEVETHWYEQWSRRCIENCRIPAFIGSFQDEKDQFIIMEDLNNHFPLRKSELTISEVKLCLRWLAHFHMTFLDQRPEGLWETGTYWHLETRPEEFEKIEHQELKSKAHLLDNILNNCKYKTIVHGDAKLANFCFSEDGKRVAAVDFQYVGGGCGMKDVAYFLGSCLTSEECEQHENELLNYYFSELRMAFRASELDLDMNALEHEWRTMFPIAWTDFTRFLLGWMPSHQKVNDYSLKLMNSVLKDL